jgi:hypothetical protein
MFKLHTKFIANNLMKSDNLQFVKCHGGKVRTYCTVYRSPLPRRIYDSRANMDVLTNRTVEVTNVPVFARA